MRLMTLAVALVPWGVLACSSDTAAGGSTAAAGTGSGGATTSATGSTSSASSSDAASSVSSASSSSSSGMVICDTIDACQDPPPGDRDPTNDCFNCAISPGQPCEQDGTNCTSNPDCVALVDCKNACGTMDCIVACEDAHPVGLLELSNLEGCICLEGCPSVCKASCAP